VLHPDNSSDPITLALETGVYAVEWFSIATRKAVEAGKVTVAGPSSNFRPPFLGPAVLYLRRAT
jgi:hypothetical protein